VRGGFKDLVRLISDLFIETGVCRYNKLTVRVGLVKALIKHFFNEIWCRTCWVLYDRCR